MLLNPKNRNVLGFKNSIRKRNPKYESIKSLNKEPLLNFSFCSRFIKRNKNSRKTISYNAIGCLWKPSPKSIPKIEVVSLPYVNSLIPERKQPILPIIIPTIMGSVNKSPEDFFSPMMLFANSTPRSPPKSPPIMVLLFKI